MDVSNQWVWTVVEPRTQETFLYTGDIPVRLIMESQSSWFLFQLCLCTLPFKKSCRETQRNSLSVWQSCEPDCRNVTGALPMPFKEATWLHETTAAFELLF